MSLTSRIQALTAYANEVTGESDTTLADAVASLAEGYGSGGIDVNTLFIDWTDFTFTPVFENFYETTFTLDSTISQGQSITINHTSGFVPDIIEVYAESGQTAPELTCTVTYIIEVISGAVLTNKSFVTNAGNDVTNRHAVTTQGNQIGRAPTGATFSLFGTSNSPFASGITYKARMYKFK